MISVVIPLYNKEKQIAKTLQTVLNQSFKDFEIIIVNDGSTDNSVAEVAKFTDSRIRLINQKNAGVSAARNRGINEAKGEYIALLDADDEWHTDYLATQMRLAENYPYCDVFAVNYQFKDIKGIVTPTIIRNLPFKGENGILSNYFEVASSSHPPICSITIMARKKAFQAIGGFPLGIKSGEDLLTWARLACNYKIAYSKKTLATFADSQPEPGQNKAMQRKGGEQHVLDGLLALYHTHPTISGLRQYILRWYKIYCVLLIETEENNKILRIAYDAMKFGGSKILFPAFMFFGLLPANISKFIYFNILK